MGLVAATVSRVLDWPLAREALLEPIKITVAVLAFGLVFKYTRHWMRRGVGGLRRYVPLPLFLFLIVFLLALLSSVITAIIASLFLVEIASALKLDRRREIYLVIIACFSIGLGAALTPIGEPLSTIAIAKLKGEPHYADFFYLARMLGYLILPGIVGLGVLAAFMPGKGGGVGLEAREGVETLTHVFVRAIKVFVFVMALIFLGEGFKPIIDTYVVGLGGGVIYWVNLVSAVLDNATITSAEISPHMSTLQIKSALMALLISGGMLIPGNIPNIIAAGKLKISSREWGRLGVPLGLVMMGVYFVVVELL